jgi:hypothetical protein
MHTVVLIFLNTTELKIEDGNSIILGILQDVAENGIGQTQRKQDARYARNTKSGCPTIEKDPMPTIESGGRKIQRK